MGLQPGGIPLISEFTDSGCKQLSLRKSGVISHHQKIRVFAVLCLSLHVLLCALGDQKNGKGKQESQSIFKSFRHC